MVRKQRKAGDTTYGIDTTYGVAHGSKIHILQDDASETALCGVKTFQAVYGDVAPAEVCLSCFKSAQRSGMIGYMACPHCRGTGKVPA